MIISRCSMSSLDLLNPQGGRAIGPFSVTSTGNGPYIAWFSITVLSDTRIRIVIDGRGTTQNATAATSTATWTLPAGTLPPAFSAAGATNVTRPLIVQVNGVLVNSNMLLQFTGALVATFTPAIGNPVTVPRQTLEYDVLY